MTRQMLFALFAFCMLVLAVSTTPDAARALSHCNNSWCDRYGGTGNCESGFPGTHCIEGSSEGCVDDLCEQ